MNQNREDSITEIAKQFLDKGLELDQLVAIGAKAYYKVIADYDCSAVCGRVVDYNADLNESIESGIKHAMHYATSEVESVQPAKLKSKPVPNFLQKLMPEM